MKKLIDSQKHILAEKMQSIACVTCAEIKTCLVIYPASSMKNNGNTYQYGICICHSCASQAAQMLVSNADVLEDGQMDV